MRMEKDYTKIPNEILEALARTRLSNYEFRCIWIIIRKTFGWNKPSDYISNSQFVKKTGIKKYHIWRTLKRLQWRKIVTKRGNKFSINTNYGEWRELPKGATITKSGIKVAKSSKKVTELGGHKEHLPNNTKQRKERFLLKGKTIEQLKRGGFVLEGSYLVDKTGNKYKPHFWNNEMRRAQEKWWVLQEGKWLEFVGREEEIEWKKL